MQEEGSFITIGGASGSSSVKGFVISMERMEASIDDCALAMNGSAALDVRYEDEEWLYVAEHAEGSLHCSWFADGDSSFDGSFDHGLSLACNATVEAEAMSDGFTQ